jgi:hypothetical protein
MIVMIKLNRSKENKWIMQKNISSSDLLEAFVSGMQKQNNIVDADYLTNYLRNQNVYHGRSEEGSSNTMGVRLSQACFYMFGYKKDENFYPSPMTDLYLNQSEPKEKISLVNLFSMQFPSPYSETPSNFNVYVGRLILKLLREPKLDKKLYVDEMVYFLPFIETINHNIYNELIDSILEFRSLSFEQKELLFTSERDYNELFANCMHEINYYFLRIFSGFGCLEIVSDPFHNDGKLFSFRHGNGNTFRTDAYGSRKSNSGYVQINPDLISTVDKLLNTYDAFDKPITQADSLSKNDWIRDLYEFEPLKYISIVMPETENKSDVIDVIKDMVYQSKYGSRDGKTFEQSLKPVFELFRENRNVEIISGSGDTDLLCVMDDENDDLYKVNVDAKTSHHQTPSINPVRITNHIKINNSKYCIIVSPKFSRGVRTDIQGYKIVTIEAETLANYCLKECINSNDGLADYIELNSYIESNLGTDITRGINFFIEQKYTI